MSKKKDFHFYWEEPNQKKKRENTLGHQEFTLSFPELGFSNINVTISSMPVDIGETEREVVIRAKLPGYKKSEISLNVTETSIEIVASKKENFIERTKKSFRQESSAGSQHVQFTLPSRVDPNQAKAKLDNGTLTVIMPKLETETRKKKKIDIK